MTRLIYLESAQLLMSDALENGWPWDDDSSGSEELKRVKICDIIRKDVSDAINDVLSNPSLFEDIYADLQGQYSKALAEHWCAIMRELENHIEPFAENWYNLTDRRGSILIIPVTGVTYSRTTPALDPEPDEEHQ